MLGIIFICCLRFAPNNRSVFRALWDYLKGKSFADDIRAVPKFEVSSIETAEFWCRGYYVDTVGKNAKKIEEYIRNQLEEDRVGEQLTMGNF